MSLFKKLFSSTSSFDELVASINGHEEEVGRCSDGELREKSMALQNRVVAEEIVLDDAMTEAFALVREAARRTLKQRHYDAQLRGGVALYKGMIAEMKTGEGKTLAATLPVYTHALTKKGVHVITVNDYLAQRDAVWMGQIYHMLGMSVACITHNSAFVYDPEYVATVNEESPTALDAERDEQGSFKVVHEFLRPLSRAEAYACDIVYGTNHEFGFDYLRDNLSHTKQGQVQRGHYYALVDEVDSVLIDEARTPMIISAPDRQAGKLYQLFAQVSKQLKLEDHYVVDEKARNATLTQEGIERVEQLLSIDNIYSPQHMQLVHYLEESIKAKALFEKDKHYVVKNGEVIIVDEFTGRLMHGRRYSGGLHQAIEAKEQVQVREESKTFAQITIQNYFRLYEKIAGMTGTAATSSEEFEKVYGLQVAQIPTNKPTIRKDLPDRIYKTTKAKYGAVVKEIQERSGKGQPILVGTTSIEENQIVSELLNKEGVRHEVLNAKNHEREGEIIAQAGSRGAVTIATNMAGRGVDIVLGGSPMNAEQNEAIKELGGLFVLGLQRNQARRIDNQLRGRAGRQGDPGETQFFLSLEDDLMRIFGGERVSRLMETLNVPEDMPIESGMVEKIVREAQKKVEGLNFDMRKHLLEYDDVLNKQRAAVYRRRQNMLEAIERGDVVGVLSTMTATVLHHQYQQMIAQLGENQEQIDQEMGKWLASIGLWDPNTELDTQSKEAIEHQRLPVSIQEMVNHMREHNDVGTRLLASLDMFWANHLENADALMQSVRMRAYGQKDPLVEYKRESYDMFKNLIINAEGWVVSTLFAQHTHQHGGTNEGNNTRVLSDNAPAGGQSTPTAPKVGRNDPCPCGAKKEDGTPIKYKHCHGK